MTVAIALPIDGLDQREPRALDTLSDVARDLGRGAETQRWSTVRGLVATAHESWNGLESGEPPAFLAEQMVAGLDSLDEAVAARDRDATRQAALDIEFASLDLELQYTDVLEADSDRIELWRGQRRIHAAADDAAAVASDSVIIRAIKDRITD